MPSNLQSMATANRIISESRREKSYDVVVFYSVCHPERNEGPYHARLMTAQP